jgi:hypothetical protein
LLEDYWVDTFLSDIAILEKQESFSQKYGPGFTVVVFKVKARTRLVYLRISDTQPNGRLVTKLERSSEVGISLSDFEPEDADPDTLTGAAAEDLAPRLVEEPEDDFFYN